VTSYDLLYQEIPVDAPAYAATLRPSGTATMERLAGELLAAVFPKSASRIAASTDEERSALFTARAPELKDYIRDTVLVRVSEILAATDQQPDRH